MATRTALATKAGGARVTTCAKEDNRGIDDDCDIARIPPLGGSSDEQALTTLVYETGVRVANLDHAPARDNKGPRAGRLTQ